MDNPAVARELSRLDPSVPFRATNDHLHHTWAKTFFSRPELYIRPQSTEEVRKLVTVARRCRRRLVTVGSGHSPSDLTCTSSWLVNLDDLNNILHVDSEKRLVTLQAGIRLHQLGQELEKYGLMLSNLGSIDSQSAAGVISTGTHGSSLRHGLISEGIVALSLVLANGQLVRCSATNNESLFRAALLSLGALGIIVEITIQVEPASKVAWRQSKLALSTVLDKWFDGLWTSHEFVRVWWLPYEKSAVVWHADKTDLPVRPPPKLFYGGWLGDTIYYNLLALAQYVPSILPWVEWLVFGLQYGFRNEAKVTEAVQPAREGLLMNCLYSQFVNEWALPLEKGPEAITRLSAWINGDLATAGIPFPSRGMYVHCPVEVRVSDTTVNKGPRPFLDPTNARGPTLYLNATLYRPYLRDPPCVNRYYEAFEWLMRQMGAKPHWAKNFQTVGAPELKEWYGEDMKKFLTVRGEVDPDGMFLGEWHHRNLPIEGTLPLQELEKTRGKIREHGTGDGIEWVGDKRWNKGTEHEGEGEERGGRNDTISEGGRPRERDGSLSPPMTATSEESFDLLAKGEASVVLPEKGR